MVRYVDSSVLVAASSREDPFHDSARRWLSAGSGVAASSAVCEVEVRRAVRRSGASNGLHLATERLIRNCMLIELSQEIRNTASSLLPRSLRSLDAIHIATALLAGAGEFATFDARQRVGAEESGLSLAALDS